MQKRHENKGIRAISGLDSPTRIPEEPCFLPERLLVFASGGVGTISYPDLSIVVSDKRFIEEGPVPSDAEVVDQTWQIVNKSGGPDRRYANNRQLPVCLYEELWLNSPSGLNELIQLSRRGVGHQLNAALEHLADAIARKAVRPKPEPEDVDSVHPADVGGTTSRAESGIGGPPAQGPDHLYCVLIEILCCLMVADGRASSKEKRCIHQLMVELGSPWSDKEVSNRIHEFIDRVQDHGYRKTLASALKSVEIFKEVGQQEILIRCLDAMSRAEGGGIGERESQLVERVKAILE